MARGSHSFTCHPHVYPRMEWVILHVFRKHLPDGVAWSRWRTSGSAYYSSIDPERMKGWVGLVGWPYSEWFTHISGHPSATGQPWDRESSPVIRRSTILPCSVVYAVVLSIRLSVHLSVTSRHCTKMAKRRITQIRPHDSLEILLFWCQKSQHNSDGVTPNLGVK